VYLSDDWFDEESVESWRTVLDDLIKRGPQRPQFLIVDGAAGLEKAIDAVWDGDFKRRIKTQTVLPSARYSSDIVLLGVARLRSDQHALTVGNPCHKAHRSAN